ncbi:unnamed protein product [Linum tenue]|uniref:G domain-containing protein n=1 Tax=Linum tenue TaxID=586396 RepID=A0AAV0QD79_9ROSI|nr:unnamed protein product [Linum tenue]
MTSSIVREIGNAVKKAARNRGKGWYTPHMAAAASAVARRFDLVDAVIEVRDARIPLASEYPLYRQRCPSKPWIIALNKMDLADRSRVNEWSKYFQQRDYISYPVNSHNKDNVKEFLNFLQSQVRALNKDNSGQTRVLMIVGIPNVGKSALANSLHQIGRISALERGKFRYATVSPHPGETTDIISLKAKHDLGFFRNCMGTSLFHSPFPYIIASHPNVFVLDTPGILPPEILDVGTCSKLALTGSIKDCLVGEEVLAQYFLAILTLGSEYKKWTTAGKGCLYSDQKTDDSSGLESAGKGRKHSLTDHTQDFIVHDVRQSLSKAITSYDGDLQNEKELTELIAMQFTALEEAFHIPGGLGDEGRSVVASKVLNLYRTGRLGHYSLDNPAFIE